MSWDIFIQDFPASARWVEEIPDDFDPAPLGPRDEIIAKILEVVPFADFSDPSRGQIDRPEFSIEVSLGKEEMVGCVALFVLGGDTAAGCVTAVIEHLGFRAIDTGTGEFFTPEDALVGLQRWRAYRDQALGSGR